MFTYLVLSALVHYRLVGCLVAFIVFYFFQLLLSKVKLRRLTLVLVKVHPLLLALGFRLYFVA